MDRLQSELHRLYFARSPGAAEADASSPLIGPAGTVRALVLELARPPSWQVLSALWQGVQAELALPAPAIAVSGDDGLQLWFSLEAPLAATEAHRFLALLCSRFLPDVDPERLRLLPAVPAPGLPQPLHARPVPARQEPSGNWSAFVAPDLAPIFAETPWLDIPPNLEGQANLLRGLQTIDLPAFEAALKRLAPRPPAAPSSMAQPVPAEADATPARRSAPDSAASADARRFLLQVMNDDAAPLALRIEAARLLLQHAGDA